MKTFFTLLFFMHVTLTLFAQGALTTGNRILGGGVSFSQSDTENDELFYRSIDPDRSNSSNRSSFGFSPYYGRLYKDYKMVGVRFNVSGSNSKFERIQENYEYTDDTIEKSFSMGGFVRQYFPYSEKFGAFLESGIDLFRSGRETSFISFNTFGSSSTISENFKRDTKTLGASIDAEIGIYFFILEQLSVETNLARFFISYSDDKITLRDLEMDETLDGEGNSTSINFRFVNNFSFDQIFRLNYYF
ncbi:MAG: hypothetical protein AAF551_07220 [Bacteroidota bacterium]